ncbi:hypothetical protein ACEPAG_9531 [Sanghuangporus baumii]
MAYFYDPSSYANTLYGGAPFFRRRPSPPPATYYPCETSDPYVRALAEEQAARAALQDAINREREARQRRAEEEAKTRIRERLTREERERARQRPQTMFDSYYPDYGYGQSSYPDFGYRNWGNTGGYGGMDYESDYPQFFTSYNPPRREPMRKQGFQSVPGPTRSQSRSPMFKRQPPSPKSPDLGPKISIPISSPSPKPSKPMKPEAPIEEQHTAATKIQSAFRIHHALASIKSARDRFDSLLASFSFPESLEFDLNVVPQGEERPKLTYSKINAPVHAHEDTLVKLLQTLDAIESHGDSTVRERRRDLVREVEKELERIDAEIRRQYEVTKSKTAPEPKENNEAMDIESETQPATEATAAQEVKMDEDAPFESAATAQHVDETDAAVAHPNAPVESESTSAAMDVEPPSPNIAHTSSVDLSSAQPASSTEVTVDDVPLAVASNESPPDSDNDAEVKTPPALNIPLPHSEPVIQSPESPQDAMKSSVKEMQVEAAESKKISEDVKPSRRKFTVEDADAEEKDYVVL